MLRTVIGTSSYDYVKPETGERKQGASFMYLSRCSTEGKKGFTCIEVRIPLECLSQFPTVPAVYDVELDQIPMLNGRGVQQVFQSATLVKPIDLTLPSDKQSREPVKAA